MNERNFHIGTNTSIPDSYEKFFVPSISEPASEKLFGVACLQPGERVLDVACGTGVVTRAAAAIVGPTGYVVGLDINPGMLATARRHAPPGCSIEWCEASAESIPFPDASFNVALCQMGLQFVPDKRAALGEMHRVLIDGGRLVANVPGPMPEVFSILTDGLARRIGDRAAAFVGAVFSLHDAAQLHALLGDAGFRDVKVDSALTRLEVPEPRDFLWQYIASTPMAEFVMRADAESRVALEHEVTDRWRQFRTDGGMKLEVRMTTATASA